MASPDRSRLLSTSENLERLVGAIRSSLAGNRHVFTGDGSCQSSS
jgi:hypothetical protein